MIDRIYLVKKFFRINNLELELWPKSNHSNSGIIDVEDNGDYSDNEILNENKTGGSGGGLSSGGLSEVSGNSGAILMTESMTGAKSLLDEVKDPLGINDSLYQ